MREREREREREKEREREREREGEERREEDVSEALRLRFLAAKINEEINSLALEQKGVTTKEM